MNYLITKQYTVFDTPIKRCVTQDNLEVEIDTVLVFRIVNPRDFQLRLSPEKLEALMRDAQEEAVRALARKTPVKDVYSLSGRSTSEMIEEMNAKFTDFGIQVKNVTITSVRIPEDLAETYQNVSTITTRELHQQETQDKRLMEQQFEKELDEERTRLSAEREAQEKRIQILSVNRTAEIKLEKQETESKVANLEAELQGQLTKIRVTAARAAEEFATKKNTELGKIRAETEAEIAKLRSETTAKCRELMANAEFKERELAAKAVNLQADTEMDVSSMLEAKREFELDKRRLDVMMNLVNNDNLSIMGANGMVTKHQGEAGAGHPINGILREKAMMEYISSLASQTGGSTGLVGNQVLGAALAGAQGTRKL